MIDHVRPADTIPVGRPAVAAPVHPHPAEVPAGRTSAPTEAKAESVSLLGLLASLAPVIAVALGVLQTVLLRLPFSSDDAVSYLDIADAYRLHHWRAALNGYWSPLYSWILALASALGRPTPFGEILWLRVVNFVLFVMALAAFDFFLRRLIAADQVDRTKRNGVAERTRQIPYVVWVTVGYAAFTYASLQWIGVGSDTPDMLTAALVYLMAGIVVSARTGERPYAHQTMLGLVGGLAYLSKTAMFPLAIVFLVVGGLVASSGRRAIASVCTGLAAFVLVAAPFAVSISIAHGRPTIGDTGMLNYTWYVNPTRRLIPNEHWQGGPTEYGVLKHPTRHIWTDPDVFEFDGPVRGTYPPWTDPSYWYDGLKIRFDRGALQAAALTNLQFYAAMFGTIVAAFYVWAFCLGGLWASLKSLLRDQWPLLVPAAAGLVMYLVATNLPAATVPGQPSTRLVAPFIVLLFLAMLAGLQLPDWSMVGAIVSRMAALTLAGATAGLVTTMGHGRDVRSEESHTALAVAAALHDMGVVPGAKVAILGRKFDRDHDHEFWARLARVQIVCQVPNDLVALQLSPTGWRTLAAAIGHTGADVLVYKSASQFTLGPRWQPLGGGYYAYRLADAAQGGFPDSTMRTGLPPSGA